MVKSTPRQVECRNLFETAGYPRTGAAALVGNFARESGPDLPTAFRATAKLDHGSQGLAQWRLGRLTSLKNFILARHPDATDRTWFGNMGEQVQFVIHELETDYPALNAKLKKGGDVAALATDVCWQYERPSKALSGIAERIAYARALAATNSPNPTGEGPHIGVVDHLQAAANTERVKAQGAAITAGIGSVAAVAVVGSNFVEGLPTWEWFAIGAGLLALVVGVIGHLASSNKARTIEQAAAGVTPNAPPAEDVGHTPVAAPDAPPSADDRLADFDAAVKAEVAKQIAALLPSRAAQADPPAPLSAGATMGVSRPAAQE